MTSNETIAEPANDVAVKPAGGAAKAPAWRFPKLNWRGMVSVTLFFVGWEIAVAVEAPGFKDIPGPWIVIVTFLQDFLLTFGYWESWLTSFFRVLWGFFLAQLLGIPLGLAFGASKRFNHIVFPVFEMMRPIPPLAWVPLSILFWPTNEASIIFITFIGPFFIITINVFDGMRSIKQEHIWLSRSLGGSPIRIFAEIVVPAVIPSIAVGMTLGIAVTWNVVIAAEMIASDSGLGRLTWEGYVSGTPPVVIVGMISIGVAGYLSTLLVDVLERRLMPWKHTS